MSTREVNADRRGPKDLMDLANKAQVYKGLLQAKEAHEANGTPETQQRLDDSFEQFADLHRHPETGKVDTGSMQATMDLINRHLKKGAN